MKKRYDYHQDDSPYGPIHNYPKYLKIAKDLGYESFSGAVADLYKKHKSTYVVGEFFGCSHWKINTSLKKQGIQVIRKRAKPRKYQYHTEDSEFQPINYYRDNLKRAKELGFESYSQAVKTLYRKYKSQRIVGSFFGISYQAVRIMLLKMGEPRNSRGGNNRVRSLSGWRGNIKQSGREFQPAD